jgi:release factor glutamine methyltransferase
MPTIRDLLSEARKRLAAASSPDSDAEELLSRLLGLSRTELRLRLGDEIGEDIAERWHAWLSRRAAGEPVQYITGRAAFRGLDLEVGREVLIPRPETEGLVEAVLGVLRREARSWPAPRVLDLGTGSGAIALAIAAEHPAAHVTATDASDAALAVARANANALGAEQRVKFLSGAWYEALPADERFEVIVSNPPYIATAEWDTLPDDVRLHEPHVALFAGSSGLEAITEIVDLAPDHLVAGGLLALELSELRAEEVAAWFEGASDWQSATLHDDLAGKPRVLLARRQTGPAIAPLQWPEER